MYVSSIGIKNSKQLDTYILILASQNNIILGSPSIRHFKNIWVTSTIFYLSQYHACCVCDTLQTSREATDLILNQSVVEKLLSLLN